MGTIRYDDLEQGSQYWHELRNKYIKTASRTPIVMGLSPFSNMDKLAQEIKFGIKPYYSKAMQLGNDLEDLVRQKANDLLGDIFMPTVVVKNDEYLASLDGINFDEDTIIEIKVSEKTFNEIKFENKIPDYYYAQIQHQMMVFDKVKLAYLVAYNPKTDEIALSKLIKKDDDFCNIICINWAKFEEFLKDYELPEVNKVEDLEALLLAKELQEINEQKKLLESREKELKESLKSFAVSDKNFIGNLTISKQKGNKKIDYVKLINDKNVDISDIENYTSFTSDSLVFRFSKDENIK